MTGPDVGSRAGCVVYTPRMQVSLLWVLGSPSGVRTCIWPILQMRKLRLREVP